MSTAYATESEKKAARDAVDAARAFMDPYVQKHARCATRYLDASGDGVVRRDGGPRDLPEGEVNWMRTNVSQKLSTLMYNHPDHVVTTHEALNSEIVRSFLKDAWRDEGWRRATMRVGLDRFIGGLGFGAYLWDPAEGFVFEHVLPQDVLYDPHTTDGRWSNPSAAGRRIKMTMDDATARYGPALAKAAGVRDGRSSPYLSSVDSSITEPIVPAVVWWTREVEFELVGDVVLKRPNLYGRVPIMCYQGAPDPLSEFPMGDYDEALGAAEMLRKLMNVLSNAGVNGGGYPWFRADMIDDDVAEALKAGSHRGLIPINGGVGSDIFGYTAVNPLNPAMLEAIKLISAGVDADQAVSQYARGSVTRPTNFATEAALEVSAGGARAATERANFEQFCEDVSRRAVEVTRAFILDPRKGEPQDADRMLWEALVDTDDVRIIEESMTWRDPGTDTTIALQLFNAGAQSIEVFAVAAQQGWVEKVPSLTALWENVLRSARLSGVDTYMVKVQQAVPGMMPPDGAQNAEGGAQGEPLPPGAPAQAAPSDPNGAQFGPGIGGLMSPTTLEAAVDEQNRR